MVEHLRRLYALREDIDRWLQPFSGKYPEQGLSIEEMSVLKGYAGQLHQFFERHGFKHGTYAALRLEQTSKRMNPTEVRDAFEEVWAAYLHDCADYRVAIISPADSKFCDGHLSHDISHRFRGASGELQEGGLCHALGRHTASVFHSMRAAEYGLRALAVTVGVMKISDRRPLDFATWGQIIEQTQKIADDDVIVNGWTMPAKSSFRAFYGGSIADAISFKDECRDLIMHTRSGFYTVNESLTWRERVVRFLERLAQKTSEDSDKTLLDERYWRS